MSFTPDFQTSQVKTARHTLFTKVLKADQPIAFVCIIHGFGEHSGRYDHVALAFAERQISTYLIDLPGHGKSSGKQGDIKALNDFILAIDALMELGKTENPALPYFMYGHSMGGGLLLRYLTLVETPPQAAVVTSPWLQLASEPSAFKIILGRMTMTLGLNIAQDAALDPKYLSHDPEVGKNYISDPLTHGKITPKAFFALRENGNYLLQMNEEFRNPILLAHGTDDKITAIEASKKLASQHPKTVSFKEWPNLRHETHNEINKNDVIDFYVKWLLEKI